jgi:dihydrofolate reductase
MKVSLVVAAAENNAIGKNNQLLWNLPNDMKFFKNTTWGMPIIMGRKTFESMGKALKGRINIVITRQPDWNTEDVLVAKDIDDAILKAKETNCKEVYIIGGGEIFEQSFKKANKIYLTRVHTDLEGDTFFPALDENEWELLTSEDFPADEKHQFSYSFQKWQRKYTF